MTKVRQIYRPQLGEKSQKSRSLERDLFAFQDLTGSFGKPQDDEMKHVQDDK